MFSWVNDTPKLIEADYKTRYTDPFIEIEEGGQTWYKGTGVAWENHPLKGHFPKYPCGNCGNKDVKIIAAQWSVSYASGDAYWDVEIACEQCGKYTKYAYTD